MCGIFVLHQHDGLTCEGSGLVRAIDAAAHRGPDGRGLRLFNSREARAFPTLEGPQDPPRGADLALAHRRLAIIDLSREADQPMEAGNGSLWITYNGEIYNYIELRAELESLGQRFRTRSDTEVILKAYERWGASCVSRFNGIWAFAIADLARRTVFCSRDRFGVKPFHYFADPRTGFFGAASEIKQLLTLQAVPKRARREAIFEYLRYGSYDHSAHTFFEGILRLPPGHNLTWRMEAPVAAPVIERYYAPEIRIDTGLPAAEAAGRFRDLFDDAVRLQLRSDVPVGSCLSGGVDSSSIVCTMHRLLRAEGKSEVQHTFSSHFEDPEANEIEYMHEVIRATGVQPSFVHPDETGFIADLPRLVWHQDEPFGSTSIFAQWSVFRLVHEKGIKVMLDGQGADEQLAGYLGFSHTFFAELLAKKRYLRLLAEVHAHKSFHGKTWGELLPGRLGGIARRLSSPCASAPAGDWMRADFAASHAADAEYPRLLAAKPLGEFELLGNLCHQMTFHSNIPALLRYEDRNSMAFSVEARVPFLDHRLVEFALALPSTLKIDHGYTKAVLRNAMAGTLPEKIRTRVSKLGFATPERRWQRTVLKPMIDEAIDSPELAPFVAPKAAHAYFDWLCAAPTTDFAPWRWLNLKLWSDAFGVELR
ncbi:MAG: asparagine synthase (glutamine-hydrolyzing) [Burkholderiales bacterium]